jgi:hypothetical protein
MGQSGTIQDFKRGIFNLHTQKHDYYCKKSLFPRYIYDRIDN